MFGGILNTFDPVNRHHPLNRGRVAWWLTIPPLDGGNRLFDLMGLKHGTLTNITSTGGWRGTTRRGGWGHIVFDGTDDRIVIPAALLAGLTAFSVAGWVNAVALPSGGAFTNQRQIFNGGSDRVCLFADPDNSGQWTIGFSDSGGSFRQASTTGSYSTGTWVRVVGTYDGANIRCYANGISGTAVANTSAVGSASANGRIGCAHNDGRFWSGSIDDVSIWSRALSASEVFADYELSRRGYPGVLNRMYPITVGASSSGSLLLARRRRAVIA